jgi:hypothetical protein
MAPHWEYACTANPHDPQTLTRHMNEMANRGWELLTVTFAIKGESGTNQMFWRRPRGGPEPEGQGETAGRETTF